MYLDVCVKHVIEAEAEAVEVATIHDKEARGLHNHAVSASYYSTSPK